MTITLTDESGPEGTVVRVAGIVDLSTAETLTERLATLVRTPSATVLVDLGDVDFLDSTGLSALVAAHLMAVEHGSELVVSRPTANIRSLLRLTGLDQVLDVRGDDPSS